MKQEIKETVFVNQTLGSQRGPKLSLDPSASATT